MIIFLNFPLTSNHFHSLQVENCDSNSRLVVDEDGNGKFGLERVKIRCERALQNGHPHFLHQQQMRQLALQGVFRMYRHFAERKAERMITLARIIVTNLPGAEEHNSPSERYDGN